VLLILLEQDLIFQHDIENKVCPILLELSAPDSEDEYRAEAVSVSLYRGDCQHLLGLSHTLVSAGLEVSQTFNFGQHCSHRQDSQGSSPCSPEPVLEVFILRAHCFKKAWLEKSQ
jgi:hypothetical protein